ncbi:hypothetical protein [Terriglobus sp. TAA 43]|uniref:hypothetical protein n=1 Tax=Terriglobus sp. TAA 43 TaxID=278961 RepID=UPI0012EDE993|nr:hypothetical protein [Terriglobus sp. TAA 43]
MAARTAFEAVDAATSPSPATPSRPASPPRPQVIPPRAEPGEPRSVSRPVAAARPDFAHAAAAARQGVAAAKQGVAAAKQGVAAPLKRASRALWHELTGSFFALFALSFTAAMWKTRHNAVSAVADDRYRFYFFCVLAVLFGYFSVSSFVRARRA